MDLNNENKHQQLTPQIRKQMKELRLSSGDASMSMGPRASVSIESGASIQIEGMVILGGQTLDVSRPPTTIDAAPLASLRGAADAQLVRQLLEFCY